MAQCILFKDAGCTGKTSHISASIPDLRSHSMEDSVWNDWSDEASSVVITSGQWQFFDHVNYEGRSSPVLGPGAYHNMDFLGLANDTISSVKLISE